MNARRVAELFAELSREFAADIDDDRPAPEPKKSEPRSREFPAPLHPPNDLARMRARKMLRRKGRA